MQHHPTNTKHSGNSPDVLDLDALGVVPLEVVEGALEPGERVEEVLDGDGGGALRHRRLDLLAHVVEGDHVVHRVDRPVNVLLQEGVRQ